MSTLISRRTIPLIITLIACSLTFISLYKYSRTIEAEELLVVIEPEPIPINMLIDNSMSAFEQTKVFDRDIETFMRRWGLKGGSFALMKNDSLIYAKGYGYANDTTECDVNNVFRVASASKLITATAIMRLVEQNKLRLDSKVFGGEGILNDSLFLDLRASNLELITVEHLLRHTAGFSSPVGDPAFSNAAVAKVLNKELPLTMDDMILYAVQNRLRTRPGSNYNYSNLGYIVLSKIVEKVSTIEYETYVKDSILNPIGCYDMYIGQNFSSDRESNEVKYYEVKEAEPVEAYDGSGVMTMKSDGGNDVNLLSGAGGWVASPTELLRFVASIDNCEGKENILSTETIERMTYDSKTDKPIGWATVRTSNWLRSGSMAGTSALIKRQGDGYTWVFISNSSSWVGARLSSYASSHITKALAKVSEWPERDLFDVEYINALAQKDNPISTIDENSSINL